MLLLAALSLHKYCFGFIIWFCVWFSWHLAFELHLFFDWVFTWPNWEHSSLSSCAIHHSSMRWASWTDRLCFYNSIKQSCVGSSKVVHRYPGWVVSTLLVWCRNVSQFCLQGANSWDNQIVAWSPVCYENKLNTFNGGLDSRTGKRDSSQLGQQWNVLFCVSTTDSNKSEPNYHRSEV
jgi:hypothetical protein